jgi:mannose-6-phosphate isomerase
MRKPNYEKFPFVTVPGAEQACVTGWTDIGNRLKTAIAQRGTKKTVVIVECYHGVDERMELEESTSLLNPALAIHAAAAMYMPEKIDALVAPFLGGDDPVFGFLSSLALPNFFDIERLWHFREQIEKIEKGIVLVVGCGASLIAWGGILIYADLARWEAQMRFRRNESSNLGVENRTLAASDMARPRTLFGKTSAQNSQPTGPSAIANAAMNSTTQISKGVP